MDWTKLRYKFAAIPLLCAVIASILQFLEALAGGHTPFSFTIWVLTWPSGLVFKFLQQPPFYEFFATDRGFPIDFLMLILLIIWIPCAINSALFFLVGLAFEKIRRQ